MPQQPVHVVQIISGFAVEGPLGGIERFGIELAQALDPGIVRTTVCGMWGYGTPTEHNWARMLRDKGIDAFISAEWNEQSPYKSFMAALRGMRHYLGPATVLHSHCQFGDVAALLLKSRCGAEKLVRTVHNEREWGKRPVRRALLTNVTYPTTFDAECGVSQQVVDNLNARPVARTLRREAILMPNALNVARFASTHADPAQVKQMLGVPETAHLVGTVGRLTEQKGYDLLLEAAAIIVRQRVDVYFVIVGDGDDRAALQQQAATLGIADRVVFAGARADVDRLLQGFTLFVSSSRWEGLPTVILESMAARVPVVATDVSGNRELVHDGETGFLIRPNDPAILAEAIGRALSAEASTVSALTDAAYQHVHRTYTIDAVARKHEALYVG